ncbi:hypothetical protein acsn021_43510 [Anaerocolumna cellulosilytica]|uniref:Peptidase S8/S53 domain-containing protein n=1 Tax=Anaerocolumna cellulosilytica TaxID=433286 RepID=A0A6S6RC30_9FIRM|nr:S8 family peptidase [Anaerocolumna cellulosilytica]MBB5195309.1 subtilisin family serine protease [Anaerocolumna cellulosilytica]BCJ96782.1 hypothetical protein acsn021_43510 [Anaerocolumna cellulosilytica]
MTEAERYKITSNNFADIIISNDSVLNLPEGIPNSTKNVINQQFAIYHIPLEYMTLDSIYKFGYYSVPTCLGLLSDLVNHPYQYSRLPEIFSENLKGNGVIIGFIDTGIDYLNKSFLNQDNTSRILSIWDQSIDSDTYPPNFFYGTAYNQEQINQALQSSNPLSIVPSKDEIGHGTLLAGIAAGTPQSEYAFRGVAPEADLAIVKLKPAKPYLKEFYAIPPDAVCFQENDIMMGVQYLDDLANTLNKPLVICLGIGTNQSDHTGTRPLTRLLARISDYYGRSVIVAAGNEGNRGAHYYGDIKPPAHYDNVSLHVSEAETGFTLQFWGTSPNRFWIDLFAPDGSFLARVPPSPLNSIIIDYQNTIIIADSQLKEPFTTEQLIVLRFQNPLPGQWQLIVYGATGDLPMQFHFWLPIHNFVNSETIFLKPNNYTTITAPGNSPSMITVTAYDTVTTTLYYYASRGNTVTNYPKPDISAPGVNITGPFLNNQMIRTSGTSLASAYTAGISAMLMEWGVVKGNLSDMNNLLIRKILTQSAKRKPDLNYPNPDWGYGTIDINRINRALSDILIVPGLR